MCNPRSWVFEKKTTIVKVTDKVLNEKSFKFYTLAIIRIIWYGSAPKIYTNQLFVIISNRALTRRLLATKKVV